MNLGTTLFAQVMDFLPWKTFHRIVDRHSGDLRIRTLSCAEQFRIMAFAQLTYRESLRDIEVCLAAQVGKLYHMGIGKPVARSTLADASELRAAQSLRSHYRGGFLISIMNATLLSFPCESSTSTRGSHVQSLLSPALGLTIPQSHLKIAD